MGTVNRSNATRKIISGFFPERGEREKIMGIKTNSLLSVWKKKKSRTLTLLDVARAAERINEIHRRAAESRIEDLRVRSAKLKRRFGKWWPTLLAE